MRTTAADQARLLCMIINNGDMQPCGGDSGNFISAESARQLRELEARGTCRSVKIKNLILTAVGVFFFPWWTEPHQRKIQPWFHRPVYWRARTDWQ